MPRFSVQMRQGNAIEMTFDNDEVACKGALAICTDLGRDIFAGLRPGSEWTMDVTNESGDLIFQIRLYSWVLE
jgi:hypothetical protein